MLCDASDFFFLYIFWLSIFSSRQGSHHLLQALDPVDNQVRVPGVVISEELHFHFRIQCGLPRYGLFRDG
jgi:hypothetical protein